MSKRALKKYLTSLEKDQLEEQILDLYHRFDEVRVFYNFIFNPREEKLIADAKFKISKEYFPPNKKRAKARRSIAHKHIKHFLTLGVEPHLVVDLMLYNLEIAQAYSEDARYVTDSFSKSMYKSFEQAVTYILHNGLAPQFSTRILKIKDEAKFQKWPNAGDFEILMDRFE